jgi:hypothetical protein
MHGDLLGFHLGRSVHHMGILLGAPQFIHALQNYGVIESTLSDPTYRRALASVWRRMEQLERYNDFARLRSPTATRCDASAGAPAATTPEARA